MTDNTNDAGLITVLVERLNNQRLPRALALKEKVNGGETLDEFDISFLETVLNDANNVKGLVDRHPEWQPIAAKMLQLYNEIAAKALENEQSD